MMLKRLSGKILHEMRFGELAHFHKIPFYPYYGTADATILYLIVLSETYRWIGDVNLLAVGFKQYGLVKEANQVMRALFDAIERFDAYRPPEVFAGLKRKGDMDFPVLYPGGANIPQAWATGSIFHMLRIMLGLRADAPHKRLYVHPTLPDWLPDLELEHLRVGPCDVSIRFWREGTQSRWEVREVTRAEGVKEEESIQVMDDPDVVRHESH